MDNQENFNSEMLNSTISLFEKGEKIITLRDDFRDIVLILGNTPIDNSLFQWITGHNSNTNFTKVDKDFDGILAVEHTHGCPESPIEKNANVFYFGCACLNDAKSTEEDIVRTNLLDKVISYASRIKIIFVVKYSLLEKGTDKEGFMSFLRHVEDFAQVIQKYRNSFAVIAIDDEQYLKGNNDFSSVQDIQLLRNISEFLLEVKQYITDSLNDPTVSVKDKAFYEYSLQFIDVILEKKEERYKKIGLFRKPESGGNLALIQEGKYNATKILCEELSFAEKVDNDFRLRISEKSKQDIDKLEEEINNIIWVNVKRISIIIQEYYQNKIQDLLHNLENITNGKTIVDVDPIEAVNLSFKLKNDHYTISSLMNDLQNYVKTKGLAKRIKDAISELNIDEPETELKNIERYAKYIEILQEINGKEFSTKPWGNLFQDVDVYISDSKKGIQNSIDIAVKKIKYRLQLNLSFIAKRIQEKYNEKLKSNLTVKNMEIQKLRDEYSSNYERFVKMTDEIKGLRTIDALGKKLLNNSNIPGISASKRYISNIENEGRYFMFLHFLSDKILDNGSSNWSKAFKNVVDFLHDSEKWYKFLSDFYLKLSQYDIQMRRANIIDFLEHNDEAGLFQETNITPTNFQIFLEKIRNLDITEYESVKNISLIESRLSELNQLVNLTLRHELAVECSDDHMFVKGEYVSLKEMYDTLLTREYKKCTELLFQMSFRRFINIFALNTIFIDRDLDLQGHNLQLILVSPRWEVIGNRTINLNGRDLTKNIQGRARDGRHPGNDGSHGKPGQPGEPGEIFFGIGGTFLNGANLTITANGGAGSPGQHGGHGRDGIDGDKVSLPGEITSKSSIQCCYAKNNGNSDYGKDEVAAAIAEYQKQPTLHDLVLAYEANLRLTYLANIKHLTTNGFGCEISSFPSSKLGRMGEFNIFDDPLKWIYTYEDYKLYGKPGKKGGNGGNGGKGGIGGHPGNVTIALMGNPSGINKFATTGIEGDKGEGGYGGKGGKDGDDSNSRCFIRKRRCGVFYCVNYHENIQWAQDKRVDHDRRGLGGKNGRNGVNTESFGSPEPAKFIHEPAKIINKYKIYLRENLTDDLKKTFLMKFSEQINKHNFVRKFYDTEGFVEEFIDLEEQSYLLKKGVDFYPFYKSLLERISEYAECAENCGITRDSKIVLSYLYTAVLTKLKSLRNRYEPDFIIDIEKFLDTIEKEIEIIKNIEKENNKAEAVAKMKREFKKKIDEKVKEADYFIENTVEPEINRIYTQIDNKIDLLIEETISLQKQSKKEKKELIEKKKELERTLELKKLFDSFRVLGRIVSVLGPYGMALGAAIELGTSVGESLSIDNKVKPTDLSVAASKMYSIENSIKFMRMERTEYLNNALTELLEKTANHPEELGDLTGKVNDMKKRLGDVRAQKLKYKEVGKLESELKDIVKTKEIDLRFNAKKKSRDLSKVMRKVGQSLDVGSMFVDMYNKHREGDERLAAISDAIDQKENEFRLLKNYEEQIYETIIPALEDMKNNLDVFANDLNKRSQVALDIGKWQIQSALKDMILQMQRMTAGMKEKDDLARCIEKLEDTMTVLITVYDRIQQYQDEQILSNHITNVCYVSTSNLPISDQNLVNVTNHLEWSIRSSLILKYYQTALNAFKQWVFPFGSYYLDDSTIPTRLLTDGDSKAMVFDAASRIGDLKTKLGLYKSSSPVTDEILIRGEFNSRCTSCESFFEWKDEEYGVEISRLLSGQPVVLKADVRHSDPGKDAIKFNLIKLNLKSKNKTIQSQLDETLKKFDVSATHVGNSYYRYNKEFYLITSPKRRLFYSFEVNDRTGNPVRESEVYRKIKGGDLMLSPYTLWIFKLNATKKSTFRELNIFKGQIDLELEGNGSYVINGNTFVDDDYEFENYLEISDESNLNYRTVRSLVGSSREEMHATSTASSSLYSPINSICHFLKMYIISILTIPLCKIIDYGNGAFKINDIMDRFRMTPMKSINCRNIEKQEMSDQLKKCLLKQRKTERDSNFVLEGSKLKSSDKMHHYKIHTNLDNSINKINDFNKQAKPFLLGEKENNYSNQSIEAPDFSYTLLFADFITRSFTGVKYQPEINLSLMSAKEQILKKCNESPVKSESDIRKNLLFYSEMDDIVDKSWFSSMKHSLNSVLQFLGFLNKDEPEEYVRDIRKLFVQESND